MIYLKYFLLPFILSLIFTPIVRLVALKKGFISYPRIERWHRKPTAILGGISIFAASAISIGAFGLIDIDSLPLILGAAILFITGLIDDKYHLAPYKKLFIQIISACLAIALGISLRLPIDKIFVIPLTLFWIVGITNSFNLLDNIDGLCAGTAAISALMLFFSSLLFTNNPQAVFGLVIAGAALGFLPYNFNPARIFMGDSGSMFLGYSLAIISISGLSPSSHISSFLPTLLIPVMILSVPIFDTIFVTFLRKFRGRKIFEGGKDHTSHRLVTLGLSPKKTVLLLYAISTIFGLIAIFYMRLNVNITSIIAFLSVVVLTFFGFFLSEVKTQEETASMLKKMAKAKRNNVILNNIILHKRRVVEVLLDLCLIWVAYYSAYFLRFEGPLLKANIQLFNSSITWIILIKLSAFFIFGLYRGVWRYISISDLLTIFKVVGIGSIASILFLTLIFRFNEYSRAVFFIDWIIMLSLISGTRISFRILGEFLSRLRDKGRNVIIFGAGDTGEMIIREIKRNPLHNYNPVCFIDDDPAKAGNKIQGIPVIGPRDRIKDLVKKESIEELIIAIPSLHITDLADIAKICQDSQITYRKIRGLFDKEADNETAKR